MEKGFTLVELLAVLIIISIITLIATPAVLKSVEDSRNKSTEDSVKIILKEAEKYYLENIDEDLEEIDLSNKTIVYNGNQAKKGIIKFTENGLAYGKMYLNGYCVEIRKNGKIILDKLAESECDIIVSY